MTRSSATEKICTRCLEHNRKHAPVARFFPYWTCRKCEASCCEHLCGNKVEFVATCSSCLIRKP